jgi:excinuclease ABC subunit C
VPLVFADQNELFPVIREVGCLRYEIGTCLGPCAALCSQSGYEAKARLAHAFLSGQSQGTLARLEQEMIKAANSQAFERAAALRDKWETLTWLSKHLEGMRLAQKRLTFVYSVAGEGGRNLWYLIHQGRVISVLPAPNDLESKRAAAEQIEKQYRKRGRVSLPGPEAIDQVLLMAAWFRRHPSERARTIKPAELVALLLKASPRWPG